MIFHKPQKKVEIPMLHIGGDNIDYVNNVNVLGIVLNHHLTGIVILLKLLTKYAK